MKQSVIVTGTDTGIGKTVFSAALTGAWGARYWKPVQSGLEEETDSELVRRLSGAEADRVLPERYRLTQPLSPHLSAELDRVRIEPEALNPPPGDGPLVIEGAGGVMAPLNRETLLIDLFARWGLPAILCARTALGTINHTLLSIEALKARGVPLLGVAFIGPAMEDSEATICAFSGARRLGRLPPLDPLTPRSLAAAFTAGFPALAGAAEP